MPKADEVKGCKEVGIPERRSECSVERFEFQAQIQGCFGSGLMAGKKIQLDPWEP
jgi:hypothetical protein